MKLNKKQQERYERGYWLSDNYHSESGQERTHELYLWNDWRHYIDEAIWLFYGDKVEKIPCSDVFGNEDYYKVQLTAGLTAIIKELINERISDLLDDSETIRFPKSPRGVKVSNMNF